MIPPYSSIKIKLVGVNYIEYSNYRLKGKVVPTGHLGPQGSRRVNVPSVRDIGTVMVVGCQPYAPAAFTPRSIPDDRKHTWYSFLLEAESTPGP